MNQPLTIASDLLEINGSTKVDNFQLIHADSSKRIRITFNLSNDKSDEVIPMDIAFMYSFDKLSLTLIGMEVNRNTKFRLDISFTPLAKKKIKIVGSAGKKDIDVYLTYNEFNNFIKEFINIIKKYI